MHEAMVPAAPPEKSVHNLMREAVIVGAAATAAPPRQDGVASSSCRSWLRPVFPRGRLLRWVPLTANRAEDDATESVSRNTDRLLAIAIVKWMVMFLHVSKQ